VGVVDGVRLGVLDVGDDVGLGDVVVLVGDEVVLLVGGVVLGVGLVVVVEGVCGAGSRAITSLIRVPWSTDLPWRDWSMTVFGGWVLSR
jgi:hypothetical protein